MNLDLLVFHLVVDGLRLAGLHTLHALGASPALETELCLFNGLFSRKAAINRPDHVGKGFPLFPLGIGKIRPER